MTRTLYLAWQDRHGGSDGRAASRQWFPVGRLDVGGSTEPSYRFRYIHGAELAQQQAGFQPLDAFPDLRRDYRSDELFALFRNRVPSPERGDYNAMLERLGLTGQPDPFEILAVSGGKRQTDNLEVFPRIRKHADGGFECRFFLHGWRYVSDAARKHLLALTAGDPLRLAVELNNPATGLALQLQSAGEYHMLGWAPRYLVADLLHAVAEAPAKLSARVVRVNPPPAPHNQRVLIEFRGELPEGVEPMSSEQFQPLVA